MRKHIVKLIAVALVASPLAGYADSSYEHTSQVTGGQFINAIKNIPFLPKSMKALTEPTSEITMVHGNQKAIVSKDYTEIWDLDKEVIIHIDNTKKNYSVVTFADMRKMLQEMPAKMAQMQQQLKDAQAKAQQQQQGQAPAVPPNLQFNFTVDVKDTGMTKMIEKYNAKQQIMTMKMIVTDTNNPGTNITYAFSDEIWTTADLPAEMKEVRDFDMRFGMKLMQGVDAKDLMTNMANMRNGGQMAMMQLFGGKPGASDAFAQMQTELAKIKGTRLVEITRMGGSGTGIDASAGAGGSSTPPPTGGQIAGQTASDSATNTANNQASRLPGGALGGALIGAFHKKKAQPAPDPAATQPTANATATATTTDVTLMEMTVQTHDFSTESVPGSVFQIPAGFKQVQSPMEQMMSK